jgi:hypothetical protein
MPKVFSYGDPQRPLPGSAGISLRCGRSEWPRLVRWASRDEYNSFGNHANSRAHAQNIVLRNKREVFPVLLPFDATPILGPMEFKSRPHGSSRRLDPLNHLWMAARRRWSDAWRVLDFSGETSTPPQTPPRRHRQRRGHHRHTRLELIVVEQRVPGEARDEQYSQVRV